MTDLHQAAEKKLGQTPLVFLPVYVSLSIRGTIERQYSHQRAWRAFAR